MPKDTLTVELPIPATLPDGSEAKDAVLRVLTIKERMDLAKKFQGNALMFAFESLRVRLLRLGDLGSPLPKEVIEDLPAPSFDELQEAALGLDLGFETLAEFRASEKYAEFQGRA